MSKPKLPRQDHIHCYTCGAEIRFAWNGTRVRITSYDRVGTCDEMSSVWVTEERWYCPKHSFEGSVKERE